jgi:hypothetical protein
MTETDLTITVVGVAQLLFGIWIGWLRWCRCRHRWVEHWFAFDHYEQCAQCGRVR